ncbi:DUF3291 domain-containing protein [Hoeflea sp. TYP-13]|uniref:DUF3291 domain-containing protein n=1 Tax=Hoeflea sp. TYP-13 TaxID=3230023 RepID=UPI0034C6D25E
MSSRVALFTFGIFIEPSEHPNNDGFHERNDPILDAVEDAPGFVARSGYDDEPGPEPWGNQVYPRFYEERGDGWSPATLSLWTDLESPMAFSYFGLHAEALSRGRLWFEKPRWPPYALWWVDGGHTPSWTEAVERHEHLHDHGVSAFAFTFKQPFDARGHVCLVDRERLKAIAVHYGQGAASI